jgi:hypothetical protein
MPAGKSSDRRARSASRHVFSWLMSPFADASQRYAWVAKSSLPQGSVQRVPLCAAVCAGGNPKFHRMGSVDCRSPILKFPTFFSQAAQLGKTSLQDHSLSSAAESGPVCAVSRKRSYGHSYSRASASVCSSRSSTRAFSFESRYGSGPPAFVFAGLTRTAPRSRRARAARPRAAAARAALPPAALDA